MPPPDAPPTGPLTRDLAVRFAGYLAERGVQQVTITTNGSSRTLHARQTDLPAELMRLTQSSATIRTAVGDFKIDGGELRCEV